MSCLDTLRRIADAEIKGSWAARAREGRWQEFVRRFPDVSSMRVLDLGGARSFWLNAPVQPASVTTVNLEAEVSNESWLATVEADVCTLKAARLKGDYDLVFSNSLIEHPGGHERRRVFAGLVTEVADRYWVQTPYRYFPVEPHWLFPGFQFLPVTAQMRVSRMWKLGHIHSAPDSAFDDVSWVELISKTEMKHYFPDAEIWCERFLGSIKSLVAVKN
jgi:hypothetical protein